LEALGVIHLRSPEQMNAKLEKPIAECDFTIEVMKEVVEKMVNAIVRRQRVTYMCNRALSQRRVRALLSATRSTLHYESRLVRRDASALVAMRSLAEHYPRYGYRRIQALLARKGHPMSADRAYWFWRAASLQVLRKRTYRRVATHHSRPLLASDANQAWAYDFVFDVCSNGWQLKWFTVIDEYPHECLVIDVTGSIRSGRVIEALARLASIHGAPRCLCPDNGREFVSAAILRWHGSAYHNTVLLDFGKPWQKGTNESFNGKYRDECLAMLWFKNRIDAVILIEQLRRVYNKLRPHSSLNILTQVQFKQRLSKIRPNVAIFQG
jgi:putative transposase